MSVLHYPYGYPFLPELFPVWNVAFFMLGACVGSFLNVCVCRIPNDETIVTTPSHCPKCGHFIAWFENIPMLSWLWLRGKCSNCGKPISPRYFIVELLTACLFLTMWLKVSRCHEPLYLLLMFFAVIMLAVTTVFIDFEHHIIPNEITFAAMIFGVVFALAFPRYWETSSRLIAVARSCGAMITGLLGLAAFAVVGRWMFKREALGWGDVKFLGAVGACLGFRACFFTVLFGSLAGAIAGPLILLLGKGENKWKSAIAFGPYLAIAALAWILVGEEMTDAYFAYVDSLKRSIP